MPTLAERYGQPQTPKRQPTLAELYSNPEPATAAPEPKAQPTLAELYGTPDESPAVAPQSPAEGDSRGFLSTMGKATQLPFDVLAEVPGVVKDYVTPSGQERLLSDPSTAGVAGAILGPLGVVGVGDSPIAQTERENRHAANLGGYEYTPQGPIDPLAAEQIIGAGARIAATGGLGLGAMGVGATEAAVRAGDIAAHEPGKLGTAGGLARVAVAGAVPAGAMKAGMAIERAVASQGITGAKAFIANALADAGVGVGAGTVQKATEMIAAGVSPTSEEFWQGMKPTKEDAVMGIPSAIAAGVGGAAASGARRARQHARLNDLEQRLELSEIQAQGNADKAAYDQMVAANAAERQRIADVEAKAAQTRDLVEFERAETNRVQEEQSIREARRNIEAQRQQALREAQEAENVWRENPTPENAEARVAAIDRANEMQRVLDADAPAQPTEQPRLALPMPEGMTAGEFPGRMINPTKGGGSSELPTREGQGQTPGRPIGLSPLRRQSQAIEATPPTAGEGVINQRGEQVQLPGEPVRRGMGMNALYNRTQRPVDFKAQPKADKATKSFKGRQTGIVEALQEQGADLRSPDTNELPKRVGAINLKRFAGKDNPELQELIAGAQMTNEEAVEAQRLVTGDLLERASKIDKWKDAKQVDAIKPNEVLEDAEAISLDNYTMGKVEEFRNNPTKANYEAMQKYLKASSGVSSATGRALGARNLYRKAVFEKLPDWDRALINTRDMFSSKGKEMPKGAVDRLAAVKNKDNPQEIIEALLDIKRKHDGVLGQVSSYRYFNMLSSPMTHALNIVSNATTMAGEVAGRPVMSLADRVVSGEKAMRRGGTRAGLAGAWAGMGDALEKARWVLKHGYKMQDIGRLDPAELHSEMVGRGKNPANYVSRALFAADEAFKSVADGFYRTELAYRNLTDKARQKNLTGKAREEFIKDNLQSEMWGNRKLNDDAIAFSKYLVHQEPVMIGKIRASNAAPAEMKTILDQGISHIMPFYNTIFNVFKKGLLASGGGYLSPLIKSLPREQKLRNFALAVNGTLGALSVYAAAKSGAVEITGSVPDSAPEREKFYESGKKPFHLYMGPVAVDYRMLGPFAAPLMHVANYINLTEKKEADPDVSVLTGMAAGLAESFAELPVLAGIGSLMEAINDPAHKAESFFANIASQYVPASSAQRFLNSSGIAGTEVGDASNFAERVQAGTVADKYLPKRVNSYGREIQRLGVFGRKQADPVYAELDRLGLNPPGRPSSISIQGESTPLQPDERREVMKSGAPAYENILRYIQSDDYKRLPDELKKRVLEQMQSKQVSGYRQIGLSQVRKQRLQGN